MPTGILKTPVKGTVYVVSSHSLFKDLPGRFDWYILTFLFVNW